MLALLLLSLLAHAEVLRHALIVGANDGGPGLDPLRYAEDDADRIAEVLIELGGFPSDQVTVLHAPSPAALGAALAHQSITAGTVEEDLFFFYYSGHADQKGLRLGEDRLSFTELRRLVRDVPADVRVGVLDACRSGEITRIKGLEIAAPFASEDALEAEGEAWLTATTGEEAAQESDRLQGSFFTHYLLSGLRGAADQDDGVVSLGEAYAYAYDRTVAHTGGTVAGTQHPAYDFRLQGKGDLPLTDVRRASATLILPGEMAGVLTVLAEPTGAPVAEIAKKAGNPSSVALQPGTYLLRLRRDGVIDEARVGLNAGSKLTVRDFGAAPVELASAKGGLSDEDWATEEIAAPARPESDDPISTAARQSQQVLTSLGSLAVQSHESLDGLDLRHSPVVAGLASGVLPGTGQVYNGQWVKGGAFLLGFAATAGGAFGLSALNGATEAGLALGPPPTRALAAMVWGWSIADASWNVHRREGFRPREGVAVSYAGRWAPGDAPAGSGFAADWILEPGFSVGLDRVGTARDDAGNGWGSLGARLMFAAEGDRLRPGAFVSSAVVLDATGGSPVRAVTGAGGNLRWYATPRYFLETDLRAELEEKVVRPVGGLGLGVHFGG